MDMDKGYADLMIAIFVRAIKDDCEKVEKRIRIELANQGIKPIKINALVKENKDEINRLVRINVAKEALAYPKYTNTSRDIQKVANEILNTYVEG